MAMNVAEMVETRWAEPLENSIAAARCLDAQAPANEHLQKNRDFLAGETPSSSAGPHDDVDPIRVRLSDVARQKEKGRLLVEFLQRPTPAWNPADHPEIDAAGGAAEWVRKLRHEAEQGFKRRTRANKKG